MSMADQLLAAQGRLLDYGGTFADLYAPDGTTKALAVRGAFVNWTIEDENLRNDYDKQAQKYHMEAQAVPPEKQDYLLQGGNRWTILDVHPRVANGITICHVCVVRK